MLGSSSSSSQVQKVAPVDIQKAMNMSSSFPVQQLHEHYTEQQSKVVKWENWRTGLSFQTPFSPFLSMEPAPHKLWALGRVAGGSYEMVSLPFSAETPKQNLLE